MTEMLGNPAGSTSNLTTAQPDVAAGPGAEEKEKVLQYLDEACQDENAIQTTTAEMLVTTPVLVRVCSISRIAAK